MIYDERPSIDATYRQIAEWFEEPGDPSTGMLVSDALIELGEADSWASVWWSYGAVHYDLTDEAYARAIDLLAGVVRSAAARAAALVLRAEVAFTAANEQRRPQDIPAQIEMLREAAALRPDWPAPCLRLARALAQGGRDAEANNEVQRLTELVANAEAPSRASISPLLTSTDLTPSHLEYTLRYQPILGVRR